MSYDSAAEKGAVDVLLAGGKERIAPAPCGSRFCRYALLVSFCLVSVLGFMHPSHPRCPTLRRVAAFVMALCYKVLCPGLFCAVPRQTELIRPVGKV